MTYTLPQPREAAVAPPRTAYLVTSGDSREPANIASWPTQVELEKIVTAELEQNGWEVVRAEQVGEDAPHGFVRSQRHGIEVFRSVPPEAPLVVAIANWQYSHHVLPGLRTHRGPILTVANFSGRWPGLVGLLNLNAGLTKMGKPYSTLWTVDGTDDWFRDGIRSWAETGTVPQDESHVRPLPELPGTPETELGRALAAELLADGADLIHCAALTAEPPEVAERPPAAPTSASAAPAPDLAHPSNHHLPERAS